MRFTTANALAQRVAPPPVNATSDGDDKCVVPPVIWQSWYHLFLPRYQRLGSRLLLEFFDDMSKDAAAMMLRTGRFLDLPPFRFSTEIAYNTERRRGAYIASAAATGSEGQGGGTTGSKSVGSNEAKAASAASERSGARAEDLAALRDLMRDSVRQLQVQLKDGKWNTNIEQLRRSLPQEWLDKYGVQR